MHENILKDHVDSLGRNLKNMEQQMEMRMSVLEGDQMLTLQKEFEKTQRRLKNLEMKGHRPMLKSDEERQEGFSAYIRKGDGALNQKSLSTSTPEEGGMLVPAYVQDEMVRALASPNSFRSLARVTTISTDAVDVLVDREDLDAGWVLEKDQRPETTTSKLEKIKIPVHEIYAKPRATQKLLDDARINVEEWVGNKIIEKFRKLENEAFLNGNGNQKPKGILSYSTASQGAWSWGKIEALKTGKVGGFSDQRGADVLFEMIEALKPQYLEGASWIMSRSAHLAVRKLTDGEGNYLWQPGIALNTQPVLLGYPVFVMEEIPGINPNTPTNSILLGNFKEAYHIVDRQEMHILRDPYSAKPYIEFYATKRVGGDVVNFEAVKILSFDQ
jgi:HK97 family phage major capsid protein